jgi:hypothetical protein
VGRWEAGIGSLCQSWRFLKLAYESNERMDAINGKKSFSLDYFKLECRVWNQYSASFLSVDVRVSISPNSRMTVSLRVKTG